MTVVRDTRRGESSGRTGRVLFAQINGITDADAARTLGLRIARRPKGIFRLFVGDGDVSWPVTGWQWLQVEGAKYPPNRDPPHAVMAPVNIVIDPAADHPTAVRKLDGDHDIAASSRPVRVPGIEVDDVVDAGVLHPRKGRPLILHGGSDGLDSTEPVLLIV